MFGAGIVLQLYGLIEAAESMRPFPLLLRRSTAVKAGMIIFSFHYPMLLEKINNQGYEVCLFFPPPPFSASPVLPLSVMT